MKHALIDPLTDVATGYRAAQVESECFEVAEPLFWVACPDDLVADQVFYEPLGRKFIPVPMVDKQTSPTVSTGTIPGSVL